MDVLFRGAEVVDGSGTARFRADVAVSAGKISAVAVGGDRRLSASRVVDVAGLILAPGFVDMHAHSDLALLTDPAHLAKVGQGCTTEVVGQDGLSYAPVDDAAAATLWDQLAAWNGKPDVDYDWRTVGEYLDRLDRGCAVNAAYLVPHGVLRMRAVGWDDRPATPSELDAMCAVLAAALDEGAFGMSAGLTYPPGMYADADELTALCAVVARHGGFFSPHHRSYGAGALEAYAEMIAVARAGGCGLHLTHATMNFDVNAGRAGELLELVDRARADGLDVTVDSYPYLAGATSLAALLPSWTMEGGPDACAARLRNPALRASVRRELDEIGSDGCHGVPVDWASTEISGVAHDRHRDLVGRTVARAADDAGLPASQFYLDLLLDDDFGTSCLMHVGDEDNVRAVMVHKAHMVGSDGLLAATRPHPRAWGTFPRYLGRYVRELGLMTLEECVAHMTSRPARRLGLADRGLVREGFAADLALFDPDAVADAATFDEPRRQPLGIPYVTVNGGFAIDEGRRTNSATGRALRRR
ncbi:MAG: N-acyl-D-amino-acid deacylase family protein [Stackebrandtia sp.]